MSLPVAATLLCCSALANATDTYDGTNLAIPAMTVGDAVYSNVVVAVGSIVSGPSGTSPSGSSDNYDPITGLVTVPAVVVPGGKTYYNVAITVKTLVSIGSVSGADSYASSRLTVPHVQTGCDEYNDVVLNVTPADIASVSWGMPLSALDQFTASAGELLIPAVQVGPTVYTNVTINAGPQNIVSSGGGGYVSASPSGQRSNAGNGAGGASFLCQVTTRGQISGMTLSSAGVPYFLDVTNSAVGYINSAGQPVEYGSLATNPVPIEGVFNSESGFAGPTVGPDGNVYFPYSNNVANAIGQLNPSSGVVTDLTIPTTSASPFALTVGPDGALWFTEEGPGQIGRVTTAGAFTEFALPSGTGALPQQIVTGPDGALWFTESGSGKIGRIPSTATPASPQVTEFPMSDPGCLSIGIASGPLNSLWYVGCTGSFNYAIDQVTTSGEQIIYQPPLDFGQADPRFLTVGSDGAIWFTDQNSNYIGRLLPSGNGVGVWTKYPYPLVHGGCCGNAASNWIFAAPDGSLWWSEFNTGNIGHLIP